MDALVELSDAAGGDLGGKARGLARLAALGLAVPPALVLAPEAYARWRASRSLAEGDFRALGGALARLGAPLAVRSSALDEDGDDRSAAGQYESVMGVSDLPELVRAVERCYHAAESDRARAYRGGGAAKLALVVQREVAATRAGIAFSADPVTRDASEILLEVVFGHGERVVAGVADPDRFRVPRDGGPVRARVAAKPEQPPGRRFARTLRDDEARLVADAVLRAEDGFGSRVDVEFCFDGADLWLVQCRPITTLARVAA